MSIRQRRRPPPVTSIEWVAGSGRHPIPLEPTPIGPERPTRSYSPGWVKDPRYPPVAQSPHPDLSWP